MVKVVGLVGKAINILDKSEASKAGQIFWTIWNLRNQIIHNRNWIDLSKIIREIRPKLDDFNPREKPYPSSSTWENQSSHIQWKASEFNHWKLNADAVWFEASKSDEVGWVIRDLTGSFIGVGRKEIQRKRAIKMLEAKAIIKELKELTIREDLGGERFNQPLVVESDFVEIIKMLNREMEYL